MTLKTYTLIDLSRNKHLFTSVGYADELAYSSMRLFRFHGETLSFHILGISDEITLVFGDDNAFYQWLLKKNVPSEEHQIERYAVVKPMSKMKDFTCSTKDGLLVKMSVSSLNMSGFGSITTNEDEPRLIYQFSLTPEFSLPLLSELNDEKPKILFDAEVESNQLPPEIKDYYKALEEKEKSDSITGIVGLIVIIAVIGYIIYSIFAEI